MFDHPDFEVHPIEDIPLNRDIFMMDVAWMADYEAAILRGINGGDWDNIGYISYVCARAVGPDNVDLSWYPNIYDRHHEVRVTLPRRHFVTCIEMWAYDEKPHIFVNSEWLENLHMRVFSVFALVDVIGVKKALLQGTITTEKLLILQNLIDDIAAKNTDVSFVSFADSLILKSNWNVGQHDKDVNYTYEPEKIIRIMPDLADAFLTALGLPIYAVVTQGQNQFYGDELTHISKSNNHISLNSLGLPFAQLQAIEATAQNAVKSSQHEYAELYMDECFFRSLKLDYNFDKQSVAKYSYNAPIVSYPCEYVIGDFNMILKNLRD